MVLLPSGGLGRLLLAIIVITTISYLVLNLVSFGGNRWITYVDVPVRFGLWRVCDTTATGLCNAWVNQFASAITNQIFSGGKPGFIRSSQALEIISLIFYIVAAGFIILGILDLEVFPFERAFMVAIGLLFICIIFLSATLGVMSNQGRDGHPLSFLDWAWWNGLVGLIMIIVCWVALISLLVYLSTSTSSPFSSSPSVNQPKEQRALSQSPMWSAPIYPSLGMSGNPPPVLTENAMMNQPYYNNPFINSFPTDPMMAYGEQNPTMAYGGQNPMMYYGEPNPMMFPPNQNFNAQNPSPIISELARQYVFRVSDAQYQRQLLEPYHRQYSQNPYLATNYL